MAGILSPDRKGEREEGMGSRDAGYEVSQLFTIPFVVMKERLSSFDFLFLFPSLLHFLERGTTR